MYTKCPYSMFLKIVKGIYEQNIYKRKDDIEENKEKQKISQGKVKRQWRREEKKSKILQQCNTFSLFFKGS